MLIIALYSHQKTIQIFFLNIDRICKFSEEDLHLNCCIPGPCDDKISMKVNCL